MGEYLSGLFIISLYGFFCWCLVCDLTIFLLGGFFVVTLICVGLVSVNISCILGFCCFMTMISGVLVLLSYCVALIPFFRDHFSIEGLNKSDYRHYMLSMFGILVLFIMTVLMFLYISFTMSQGSLYFRMSESFKCGVDWIRLSLFLSLFLLFCVVVCVNVCSKYSGALVSEKWFSSLKKG